MFRTSLHYSQALSLREWGEPGTKWDVSELSWWIVSVWWLQPFLVGRTVQRACISPNSQDRDIPVLVLASSTHLFTRGNFSWQNIAYTHRDTNHMCSSCSISRFQSGYQRREEDVQVERRRHKTGVGGEEAIPPQQPWLLEVERERETTSGGGVRVKWPIHAPNSQWHYTWFWALWFMMHRTIYPLCWRDHVTILS